MYKDISPQMLVEMLKLEEGKQWHTAAIKRNW